MRFDLLILLSYTTTPASFILFSKDTTTKSTNKSHLGKLIKNDQIIELEE